MDRTVVTDTLVQLRRRQTILPGSEIVRQILDGADDPETACMIAETALVEAYNQLDDPAITWGQVDDAAKEAFALWMETEAMGKPVEVPQDGPTPCSKTPELFFPDWEGVEDAPHPSLAELACSVDQAQAKTLCREQCTAGVRRGCLLYAVVTGQKNGVWGGWGAGAVIRITSGGMESKRDPEPGSIHYGFDDYVREAIQECTVE